MPARLPSWAWVSGLTVGAVAAVTVLAVRADQGPHPHPTAQTGRPSASASPSARPTPEKPRPVRVPDGSGIGRRIVYSLGRERVWLIDASEGTRRTFAVWPGTVDPDPGSYTIGVRRAETTGSDGVDVENIVYFAAKTGLSIAFSNAVDGSSPPPAEGRSTGGIRLRAADGAALWQFGTTGTKVTVVP